jgi:ADP-heptose:LPS heptosyltransferase
MAFIDRYIGIVACFVMDIVQLFRDVIRKVAVKDRSIKKILLIKFLGMGSIILLKPAVRQIRGTYKDAKISFVTFAENREILRHFSDIDEVITLRRNSAIIFCNIISTIVKLYVHGYDVVIDFEFLPRLSVVLAFFSRAWIRIGFFLPGIYRGKLLLNRRLPFNYYQHVAKSFAELVALMMMVKIKSG